MKRKTKEEIEEKEREDFENLIENVCKEKQNDTFDTIYSEHEKDWENTWHKMNNLKVEIKNSKRSSPSKLKELNNLENLEKEKFKKLKSLIYTIPL